jgi:predicted MPP superfamily phosphohydrolase
MKYRKTNHLIMTLMLTSMFLMPLMGSTDSSEDKTPIKEVKQETQELIQALGTYTVDQRDEAIESTKTALDKLDKRIDALETRLENNWNQMNKATREKARSNLDAARKQRTEVADWYNRLETSSADAWDHTKKGFSDAYKNLSDAWEKSVEEFGTNK